MAKRSFSKGIIRDIIIVGIAVLTIWVALQFSFGGNPFYVVASGSMIPVLQVYDVIIVQGHCFDLFGFFDSKNCSRLSWYTPFEDIVVGDIIVFNRPSDHNRVIVHRVDSVLDDDPKTIRTKGDANPGSIPGTDFPITEEEYIGKVAYTVPQVGYVTQLLKPPVNYVIIAIVIGVMIVKQISKKEDKKDSTSLDSLESENQDVNEELSDVDKIEKDSEYSEHVKNQDILEDDQDKHPEDMKKDKDAKKGEKK